jgi:hypothetical protein
LIRIPELLQGYGRIVTEVPERETVYAVVSGLKKAFAFEHGVAVENDAITIVLFQGTPSPSTIGHVSFHLRSVRALREALADLRKRGVEVEDPGDEIGAEAPGSPHVGL